MRFSFFHFFIPFVVQTRLWKSCTAYIYISTGFQQAWSSLVHSVGWIPFSFSSLELTKDTMWYMCFFLHLFVVQFHFFFNGLLPLWLSRSLQPPVCVTANLSFSLPLIIFPPTGNKLCSFSRWMWGTQVKAALRGRTFWTNKSRCYWSGSF